MSIFSRHISHMNNLYLSELPVLFFFFYFIIEPNVLYCPALAVKPVVFGSRTFKYINQRQ